MNRPELAALASLKFDVAPVPDDVWRPSMFHVDSLHREVLQQILDGLDHRRVGADGNPLGIVVQGIAGSGKTHLMGWVRERIQASGGYFVLVGLLDGEHFWTSAALALADGLQRRSLAEETQLSLFLARLCKLVGITGDTADAVTGKTMVNREQLDEFVQAISEHDRSVALRCHNTIRALVLLGAKSMALQDIGYTYLQSIGEMEPGERRAWGVHPDNKPAHDIVREASFALALTGPTVVAIDEIDTLIAQAATKTADNIGGAESDEQTSLINQIADGMMALRNTTHRTLTVVACLPSTWTLLSTKSAKSFKDRFHPPTLLNSIPNAKVAGAILEKRFARCFAQVGFVPPYGTWPIRPEALVEARELTPRRLIARVDSHIRKCERDGVVRELFHWEGDGPNGPKDPPPPPPDPSFDGRFEELRKQAQVAPATGPQTEDAEMSSLLHAGLAAWIEELGPHRHAFKVDPQQMGKYPLHARLRQVLDEELEDEQHWSFRGISHTHGNAILPRIQAARTNAGLSKGITKRKLILLRNGAWNKGPRNQEIVKEFTDAGGVTLPISEDDLRTFAALRKMMEAPSPELNSWLRDRRPASHTALLRVVLGEVAVSLSPMSSEPKPGKPRLFEKPSLFEPSQQKAGKPSILVGAGTDDGQPLRIELESLRKHTAIFAGSGSGKTVLIRRLIEECALHGVSTIVLDPNNDLARLGDGWPQPPLSWLPGDADRARRYLAGTDVVIWTPRREAGRPLSFQPLPDFGSVLNDPDELGIAIDAAVVSVAPRAKVDGSTAKALRGQAVLKEAMTYFARRGGEGVRPFIGLLASLPEGISQLEEGEKIAFDMSQNLTAAMVTDPLFGGAGSPADPGMLLTPQDGKRARISVISFVGLPSEEQRQNFVNQLQMALFAWIKRHPAGDRPLGGLLVMDEAQTLAPSGPITSCTASTLALASQARKYGLGLVFATQAPKGLHNRISGNAATQFYGLLNSPVQIEAAREMARAKGGDVADISRLGSGQFYASGEGFTLQKVSTPMCLSHHPSSPLSTEEVLERAKRGI